MVEPSAVIDPRLVERAQGGDDAALERLIEASYPLVRRWALVQLGEQADADDLTQDVLIRMVQTIASFQGASRFETWLFRVVRNAAADRVRKRRRRAELMSERDVVASTHGRPAADPARTTEAKQRSELIHQLFRALPARQREVFDLVELQGLTATEVGERLEIEAVSVRAHLFKARRAIRGAILDRYPEFLEDAR